MQTPAPNEARTPWAAAESYLSSAAGDAVPGWRTFDAGRVSYFANHPLVRPDIGGEPMPPLDFALAVEDDANQFLIGEHGCFVCVRTSPGAFDVCAFIMPEGRGAWSAAFADWAREYLADHGARNLWALTHPDAASVKAFPLIAGSQPIGMRSADLGGVSASYLIFDWSLPGGR